MVADVGGQVQRLKLWLVAMATLTAMGVTLKLAGKWYVSWWFATAPLWFPSIVIGCYLFVGLAAWIYAERERDE